MACITTYYLVPGMLEVGIELHIADLRMPSAVASRAVQTTHT